MREFENHLTRPEAPTHTKVMPQGADRSAEVIVRHKDSVPIAKLDRGLEYPSVPKRVPTPEKLTSAKVAWESLYGEDLTSLPFDERQAVEAAIALGYGPSHITRKGVESPTAKEVIRNSLLTQPERMVKAAKLLRRELSPKEQEALLRAHNTGAGVYSNTKAQLAEKVRILRNEGFSKEEIRILIEAGLAAAPIPPGTYTDVRLVNIVAELNAEIVSNGTGNPLQIEYVQGQIERVRNLLDQGFVNSAEATSLLGQLSTWMREAQEARAGRYYTNKQEKAILTDDGERERLFEEIFVGVDATPGTQFQLGLDASSKFDYFLTLLDYVRVFDPAGVDITDDPTRVSEVSTKRQQIRREFSGKREVRQILHNANFSATGGGDINAFAQSMSTFQSEHIDLIFEDPLVSTALRMFEQAFQQTKADNKGQLPYEELAWDYKTKTSKLEDKVWALMRKEIQVGIIPNVPEWRLRRAVILARGFGVASLRFPEITAQARLPEETSFSSATEKASRFGSIYGEALAKYLDPIEHIIEKFFIGKEDGALLYYFLTGDKRKIQSKDQLRQAIKMKSQTGKDGKRLTDIINIFRIGGGFSNSSWRAFMSMKGFSPEEIRSSGLGIREARVGEDIKDIMLAEVERDFAGRPEEDKIKEIERRKEDKSYMDGLKHDERLSMWQDALKANPLRVMWQWEEKAPGQRVRFLSEALGITEAEAKTLLPQIEQDLMMIQENTVQGLAGGTITYANANIEMLKYSIIGGATPTPEELTRRNQVSAYVEKIREKARANNHAFIESLLKKTDVQGSPFPFVIGFEEIPFSNLNFINTGGRGFARRIKDYAASVQATDELMNLIVNIPKAHDIRPLIESLDKIKQFVAQYDKDIAMEVVPYLARGLIKMYDKDLMARMPLGIGTLTGMISDSSFAQTIYGREAMAWDEGDKFNFTRHLLQNNLVSKKDMGQLRKDVGATPVNFAVDLIRTYGQLALLLLLFNFAKSVANDK